MRTTGNTSAKTIAPRSGSNAPRRARAVCDHLPTRLDAAWKGDAIRRIELADVSPPRRPGLPACGDHDGPEKLHRPPAHSAARGSPFRHPLRVALPLA